MMMTIAVRVDIIRMMDLCNDPITAEISTFIPVSKEKMATVIRMIKGKRVRKSSLLKKFSTGPKR